MGTEVNEFADKFFKVEIVSGLTEPYFVKYLNFEDLSEFAKGMGEEIKKYDITILKN